LKELKLGEPLIHCVRDFRPTGFVLILNDQNVCVESLKVSLLALSGCDRFIKIIADGFRWTGARPLASIAGNRDP
jgi:hypothetical protein